MIGNAANPLDDDRALAAGLAGAAEALDREIAASGALDRVVGRVRAGVAAHRRAQRRVWLAIAAALILAAGLGSLADVTLIGARGVPDREVVVMDPLIFGTAMVNQ